MSGRDLFERVLGSLHEAVLDDGFWPATSGLIDKVCGSKGNLLITGDGMSPDDIAIFFARFCYGGRRRLDFERMYFEHYHAVDERLPRVRLLPDSRVVHVGTLYSEKEKKTSPVYNEVLPESDTADSLSVRLDGPHGSRIAWTFADPVDRHGWSSARVETIERLLPHLRQYVRVTQALDDARAGVDCRHAAREHPLRGDPPRPPGPDPGGKRRCPHAPAQGRRAGGLGRLTLRRR